MIKNLLFLVFCLFLLLSCQNKQNSEVVPIKPFTNYKSIQSLSEIAEIDTLISISNQFGYLNQITKMVCFQDNFLIYSNNPKRLSIVTKNGVILNTVTPNPDKPFEISDIADIDVFEDYIFVLSREYYKMHILNRNLNLIKTHKLPLLAQSFKMLSENEVLFYSGHEPSSEIKNLFVQYSLVDKKILNQYIDIPKETSDYFKFLTTNHIIEFAGRTILWDSTLDKVYNFNQQNLEEYLKIDYQDKKLPKDYYKNEFQNSYEFITKTRQTSYAFRHFNFMSNKKYLHFNFEYKNKFLTTIYNHKTQNTITCDKIEDDILTGLSFSAINFFDGFYEDNKFIKILPYEYLNKDLLEKYSHLNPEQDIMIQGHLKY